MNREQHFLVTTINKEPKMLQSLKFEGKDYFYDKKSQSFYFDVPGLPKVTNIILKNELMESL